MEDLIYVENLMKSYPGFTLQDISLSVAEGSVVGLVGSNGAGKTTLLKTILGLVRPDDGTIRMMGQPNGAYGPSGEVKQSIGTVFDACPFPDTFRVREGDTLGRTAFRTWNSSRYRQLCEGFGLDGSKMVKELSRGMGMKLSLAFALAHEPSLLILDEATAGLDPMAREDILDLLRRYMEKPGRAILMATHITSDLEKIADEIICIDGGRLIFREYKDDICDRGAVAHCRAAEFAQVMASGLVDASDLRYIPGPYGTDLLVPDRFAFARKFPAIALEPITIEEFMALTLKGQRGEDL